MIVVENKLPNCKQGLEATERRAMGH
jgi:hypothetical protein